jgi:hypothetical protein
MLTRRPLKKKTILLRSAETVTSKPQAPAWVIMSWYGASEEFINSYDEFCDKQFSNDFDYKLNYYERITAKILSLLFFAEICDEKQN